MSDYVLIITGSIRASMIDFRDKHESSRQISQTEIFLESVVYRFMPPDMRRICGRNPAEVRREYSHMMSDINYDEISCWIEGYESKKKKAAKK